MSEAIATVRAIRTRLGQRRYTVTCVLLVLLALTFAAALYLGDYPVAPGDVLLALPSTGLHTNGYSLARKVLFAHHGLDDRPEELGGQTVGEALLAVHRSYLAPIRALIDAGMAKGFVHVTGGGIPGNTPRVLPEGTGFEVDYAAWPRPGLFRLIERLGEVPEEDMRRTFNLGVGLVAVVAAEHADAATALWQASSETVYRIGHVTAAA